MVTLSGREVDRLRDADLPVVPRLADHAGDEVDVDLREAEVARPAVRPVDFVFEMSPAVVFEDLRLEVLDAEAQPGDAHVAERFELVLLQRARLALEGDFLGASPREGSPGAVSSALASCVALRNEGVPPPK